MAPTDSFQKVETLTENLRANPKKFLKEHQHESTTLEYKVSFEYDLALDLCPLVKSSKKLVFNQTLSLRILKTLVAFANTYGGLLVFGVGEKKAQIVENDHKIRCDKENRKKLKHLLPCYDSSEDQKHLEIGELRVFGLDQEFSIAGMDFDKFQRHVSDRVSMGKGTSRKKFIKFDHLNYPCDPVNLKQKPKRWTKVSMSESVDQYIDEIFPVQIGGKKRGTFTFGAVSVKPSAIPIYLTIEESGSRNILYALPVRKTGKTELEKDLGRVQTYIASRFGSALAEQIAEKLLKLSGNVHPSEESLICDKEMPEVVARYALEWKKAGYPYHMVEKYGKQVKAYTGDLKLWKNTESPEIFAFLLMVSLHYNAGWEEWTPQNTNNKAAVQALFEALHMNYWRTRFRALYALQFMDQKAVKAELRKKKHQALSEKTIEILKKVVPSQTVVKVIQDTSRSDLGSISRKAKEVLAEIATQWKDSAAGVEPPL